MNNIPVIFRTEPNDRQGGLVAIFPTLCEGYAGWHMRCYTHVGQHGSASLEYYQKNTVPAEPGEYFELLQELRGIYSCANDPEAVNLVVYERMTSQHKDAWRAEANRMANA